MINTLKLIIGLPKYEKKSILFYRINLISFIFFFISFFIFKEMNLYIRFIPSILLITILIISRKYFKYNPTGEITFFDDYVLIINDEKEISINYSDIKKIVFIITHTGSFIDDGIYATDGFHNKVRLFGNDTYEYAFFSDEDKIEQIRLFVRENKSKYNISIQRTLHNLE